MPTPATGTGPGFDTPLPAGGTNVPSATTAVGMTAEIAQAMTEIETQYADSIKTATDQQARAQQAYSAAQAALDRIPSDDIVSRPSAQTAMQNAARDLQTAADTLARVQEARAKAYDDLRTRRNLTPQEKDLATARADDARAQATLRRTQADVAGKTAPSDIAKATADAAEAAANAQLTASKVTVAQATTQAQIDAANIAVQQAQANVEATRTANKTAAAQATTATAQAAVSPQLAQTSVDQAQANVNKTLTEIADLQRQLRQAPTDEQAQQAIQTQLAQKQVELQTSQQQLDQAKQLLPIAVAQGQANVTSTQTNTAAVQQGIEKNAQGPVFGISDQIAKYKQMIASGQMQPDEANAAINDWLTKQVTGAGSYERQQQANAFNQQNYQTQSDFNRNMAQTAGSFMNTGLGTLTSALGTMTPGHGAEYAGAVQALSSIWNQIGSKYAAPQAPQNAVSSAPVVHINIGGGQPTSSSGGGATDLSGAPATSAAPQQPLPDHMRPGTPEDVMANWQNELASGVIGGAGAAAGQAGAGIGNMFSGAAAGAGE